jgi:hypothetical protein
MTNNNFDMVWRCTRRDRKKLSRKFYEKMKEKKPDLAKRAKKLNAADDF